MRPPCPTTRLGFAVLVALFVPACGRSGPEMARVSGKITYDGKPVTEGNIAFASTAPGGANANSPIGPDGSYDLLTNEKGDGAQVGEYMVSIIGRGRGQILDYIPKTKWPLKHARQVRNPETSGSPDRQVGTEYHSFRPEVEGHDPSPRLGHVLGVNRMISTLRPGMADEPTSARVRGIWLPKPMAATLRVPNQPIESIE